MIERINLARNCSLKLPPGCNYDNCDFYRPFRLSEPHMKYIKQCIRWVCCAHQGKLEDVMNILKVPCWMDIDPKCVRDTVRLTDCIHFSKRAEYQCHLVEEDVVKTHIKVFTRYGIQMK